MKNMKLSLILTGLMGISLALAQETPLVDATPDKVEFAWDLHDVLVNRNWGGMAKTAWNYPGLISGLCKLPFATTKDIICWPFVSETGPALKATYALAATGFKGGATGEPYAMAVKPYSSVLAAAALKIASMGAIDVNVVAIIDELDALGYTQRIASNIGTEEVKELAAENSTLFAKFKGGKTVTFYEGGSHSAKKPTSQYFEEYNAAYNPDGEKITIFIDDQLKNINGAKQIKNFVPVQFKNAEQLRKDLKKLGVPLS